MVCFWKGRGEGEEEEESVSETVRGREGREGKGTNDEISGNFN